jgi:hypothetical protein
LLKEHEIEITRCGLKYLDKLIVIKEKEKEKKNIKKKQDEKPSYLFLLVRH